MYCCHFCNVSFLTLNIVARIGESWCPRVFSFCWAALRGCLSFAGDPSASYMLSHIISQIFLIFIDTGKFLLTETVSLEIINLLSERYGLKTAGRGILSNAVKEYRSQFLIGRTIFLTREKRRSLFWLARTYFRTKIYEMAFEWVNLSTYIINSDTTQQNIQ